MTIELQQIPSQELKPNLLNMVGFGVMVTYYCNRCLKNILTIYLTHRYNGVAMAASSERYLR